jgi:hypothetical protein
MNPILSKPPKVIFWILLILATVSAVISISTFLHARNFNRKAAKATGQIIQMLEKKDHDNDTVFYPVFSFSDSKGEGHTIYSTWGSFPPAYSVGEKVNVLYSPKNPKDAKIESFFSLWGWSAITGIIAVGDLIIAAILWLVSKLFLNNRTPQPSVAA